MAISEKKRLQVANVCYASVSGLFARFCNPDFRGPNFTWEWFIQYCEEEADLWMMIHNVRGNKKEINVLAKQFAKEIASNLVKQVTKNYEKQA